jgi:hypothetical protein
MAYATINKGADYFTTALYTGTGSTQSITTGFSPDLVWIKGDVAGTAHYWFDSVRGTGRNISSNSTAAEVNWTGGPEGSVSAFNSTSFSLSADTNGNANYNGRSYFSWSWRASDSSAVTNTSGSITSTVSANTTAGFSIVTYTGTGANASIGHGLGAVPKFIIVKCRSNIMNWPTYNVNATNGVSGICFLDVTDAEANYGTSYWQQTPTSTLFYVGSNTNTNNSGYTYVAYVFTDIKGYSKFGSWTSNGSSTADAFVYTGFKPAWVMMKMSSSANSWFVYDNKRVTYNPDNSYVTANTSDAAGTNTSVDFYSNGFRSNGLYNSYSGQKIIYMAFAENPFVLTDGTPVTAR